MCYCQKHCNHPSAKSSPIWNQQVDNLLKAVHEGHSVPEKVIRAHFLPEVEHRHESANITFTLSEISPEVTPSLCPACHHPFKIIRDLQKRTGGWKGQRNQFTNGQSVDFASASMPLSAERGGYPISRGNMSALADVAATRHTRWSLHIQPRWKIQHKDKSCEGTY